MNQSAQRIFFLALAVTAAAALAGAPAVAAKRATARTDASSLHASCSIGNVNGVDFPPYDVFSNNNDDGDGSFSISCSGNPHNTTVRISLSAGSSNSYDPRRMPGPGTAKINYNLFAGPAYRTIWGDGSDGSHAIQQVVGASPVTMKVYGRVFGGQRGVLAGTYADSITITIAP